MLHHCTLPHGMGRMPSRAMSAQCSMPLRAASTSHLGCSSAITSASMAHRRIERPHQPGPRPAAMSHVRAHGRTSVAMHASAPGLSWACSTASRPSALQHGCAWSSPARTAIGSHVKSSTHGSRCPTLQLPRSSRPPTGVAHALLGEGKDSSGGSLKTQDVGNGVYVLMLVNAVVFLLDQVLHLPFMSTLYLYHTHTQWYQWVTHMFAHASWGHISNNLFFLLTFGRLVEETEGTAGIIFVYLTCGLGAAAASFALSPANTVSVGASGAIFGLFAYSVLSRLASINLRRALEALVLGQFVVRQVLDEVAAQAAGGRVLAGGLAVSHLAHLGGALAGVLLVLALNALPSGEERPRRP